MKRILLFIPLLVAAFVVEAQKCPPEWVKYTSDGYFYDVESGKNTQGVADTKFKNDLLDLARSNLAKQIQVKVDEESQMNKTAVNGRSSINYSSSRNVSTNLDMQLAETRTLYDPSSEKHYAIAFINKEEACAYYKREVNMAISGINSTIGIANNYIASGFKTKAKDELKALLPKFDEFDKPFFWLNVFELPTYQLNGLLDEVHGLESAVKSKLAELEHGIAFCMICNADNFGRSYPKLLNEIKGELSAIGCNFTDNASTADYVIRIDAKARQYNKMTNAGGTAYFTYIDASVSIDKVATSQRIYEDEIQVKGSHTLSYEEAARDGYRSVSKKLVEMLKPQVNK